MRDHDLALLVRQRATLLTHLRGLQPKPRHLTLTDFQAEMGENNLAKAIRILTCARPLGENPSCIRGEGPSKKVRIDD